MNLKDLIQRYAHKDEDLYRALLGIIEKIDLVRTDFDTLNGRLALPDFAYAHSHVPKCVRVRSSIDRPINDITFTIVTFGAGAPGIVDFDNDFMYDPNVSGRITIKTPGKYIVGANITWNDAGAGKVRVLNILKNGVTVIANAVQDGASTQNTAQVTVTAYNFAQDDFVQIQVYQDTGGVIDVLATADHSPCLWAVMVERSRNKGVSTENFPAGEYEK